jgi:molybdenum-dependent DNA-binding transcriptional regulator ModE
MNKVQKIRLGYEVGTGKDVDVPLAHTFVAGQTQVSGKTTTLVAIVARSGRRALAFVTKRGEQLPGRIIRPYLPREGDEAIHWRFVETIMASALGQKALKYERLQIISAAKDAMSLDDVRRNITRLLMKAKSGSPAAGIYELLGEYLDLVLPEMRALNAVHDLDLRPGLNVMDLVDATPEMQALAIGAAIGRINDHEEGVLTVFPEAWQFAPRDRNTAAKFSAERTARTGAAIGNFLLSDSQDIIGVSPVLRQASTVWIIGVQREANELKRTLNVVKSSGIKPPTPSDVATLGIGQFFACFGSHAIKTYVQPAGMSDEIARAYAMRGGERPDVPIVLATPEPPPAAPERQPQAVEPPAAPRTFFLNESHELPPVAMRRRAATLPPVPAAQPESEDEMPDMSETNALLRQLLERSAVAPNMTAAQQYSGPSSAPASGDDEALYQRFKVRLLSELPRIAAGGPITITPAEKLRKDFQRDEVTRIVTAARELGSLSKRVLKLLETTTEFVNQTTVAQRLGRPTGGGSWTDLGKQIKALVEAGFVESKERIGSRSTLRAKIAADLAFYQASEAEVDAVYQTILTTIATGGLDDAGGSR